MTTPTAGEVLTVSDEEIADLLKQITDLGRLLDISQECVRDLRARLAAAESERDVQTALLADASSQLCTANARLREYEDAPVVGYEIVFKTGRWLKYDPEGYSPEITNELIVRPRGGKGE